MSQIPQGCLAARPLVVFRASINTRNLAFLQHSLSFKLFHTFTGPALLFEPAAHALLLPIFTECHRCIPSPCLM
jgi:hypothetical protein